MLSDLIKSFTCAFAGLGQALLFERNFRTQWLMALMATLAIYWANFELIYEMLLLVIISLVLSLELVNSAIEKACDSSGKEYNIFKKTAKDFGAASVLLASILSLLVFGAIAYADQDALMFRLNDNFLLPIFWLLLFMGYLPLALLNKLSPYALMICVPNVIIHILIILVTPGSLLFLGLSVIFHLCLLLASARRAFS